MSAFSPPPLIELANADASPPLDALVPQFMGDAQSGGRKEAVAKFLCAESRTEVGFWIREAATAEECRGLIDAATALGFSQRSFEGDGRDGSRSTGYSPSLAALLFERLRRFLPQSIVLHAQAAGLLLEQCLARRQQETDDGRQEHRAVLACLSPFFHFERYGLGQRLKLHRDGCYRLAGDEPVFTALAVLVYLNDEYEGGCTRIATSKPRPATDIYHFEELRGKLGDALVFRHEILHQGGAVTGPSAKAVKHVLRLDVAYQLVGGS